MSELDVAKEQIAYLEFWLDVMAVSHISLVGWPAYTGASAAVQKVLGGSSSSQFLSYATWFISKSSGTLSRLEELSVWKSFQQLS
jgi:hypothetical protein